MAGASSSQLPKSAFLTMRFVSLHQHRDLRRRRLEHLNLGARLERLVVRVIHRAGCPWGRHSLPFVGDGKPIASTQGLAPTGRQRAQRKPADQLAVRRRVVYQRSTSAQEPETDRRSSSQVFWRFPAISWPDTAGHTRLLRSGAVLIIVRSVRRLAAAAKGGPRTASTLDNAAASNGIASVGSQAGGAPGARPRRARRWRKHARSLLHGCRRRVRGARSHRRIARRGL